MSDGKSSDRKEIKPQSEVPVGEGEIITDIPHRELSVNLATTLSGMRPSYFRDVVREGFDESISSTVRLQTVAKVFARCRPSPTVLSQRHFTTEEGIDGLLRLIDYLENCDDRPNGMEDMDTNTIHSGSCYEHMSELPPGSMQTVVTSPPYWGTRLYPENFDISWSDGLQCPFGFEPTPETYIRHTIETFLKLGPLLADDGTIWWNVGDVYNTRSPIRSDSLERIEAVRDGDDTVWSEREATRHSAGHEYLKDKDIVNIPHRIAKGLQRSGFWVRSLIIWEKGNVVPEGVTDRPTVGHEMILLVSKSKQYKFDEKSWRESVSIGKRSRHENENLRTVWKFNTAPGKDAHGAPFPVELPARCITLSTDTGDIVYDPFLGSGTTAIAAQKLGRKWVGSEISEEYIQIANDRISDEPIGHTHSETSLDMFVED